MKNLKPKVSILLVFSIVLVSFPQIGVVKAEAKTIVVPEDYSTIQDAISNAADGDTVLVKNGIYRINENTTIVISKTLSLIGEDPTNTTIIGTSSTRRENGFAIRLAAPNITISGFTITNFWVGIVIANYYEEPYPSGCKIINNNIVNNSEGIRTKRNDLLVSENNFTKNYVGITGYNTENVIITRNNITRNGNGINIGICRNITISENQITDNEGGLNLRYYGPHFVCRNNIMNNSWGIRFAECCSNATIYCNNIARNDVGVVLLNFPNAGDIVFSGVGNTVSGNLFINNTKQVRQEESIYNYSDTTRMGTDIVFWNNSTIGNYWSDYNGTDANGDEIGDLPYVIDAINQDNYPLIMTYETAPSSEPAPKEDIFPTMLVVASVLTVAVAGIGIMVYFKKREG